jgi:aromatic-L-amino-acid/L-tryptophan decarboxylase
MAGACAIFAGMSNPFPLELTGDEMRRMVSSAMDRIVDHIESLPQQPAADIAGSLDLARTLIEADPPEVGTPFEELLDPLFREWIPKSFNTAGPGYLAYIPGGGIFHAAVADLIAAAVNRYVGVFAAAPALVQLESNVIRWFCRFVGYPAGAGGVLTTGGSLANFTAVVTARNEKLGHSFRGGILYASDQVHHSVQKAASLAGFPHSNVREIPTDDRLRMRLDALEESIARDRASGLEPFMIVGSAGTTNTGAVDDLSGIAAIARRLSIWFHVDAAYGGFFILTKRGRAVMRGIEEADSITLDPHKALFIPYGTGSLLVRDAAALQRAHSLHAVYLPQMQEETGLVDFCEISPELSRGFRGLRVWLPLKMAGVDAFRRQLDEKLDLTLWATEQLRLIPGVEIVAEPQLSIVGFRFVREALNGDELNRINERILARINDRKRVMVTSTVVGGRYVIRICVVSFRTHADRMAMAIEDIRAAISEA